MDFNGKMSVTPNILNVAMALAIDLFIILGDREKTIQNTDRKTLLQSNKQVRSMRALLDYAIPFDKFMIHLRRKEIGAINKSVQFFQPVPSHPPPKRSKQETK